MMNIRSILFPTDFSECAEHAFQQAAYLADQYGAALHVLHVRETRKPDLVPRIQLSEEEILEQLQGSIQDAPLLRDEPHVRLIRSEVRRVSASVGILEYADEHRIDLIVMGTHGRHGVSRLLVGSVAEEVVRLATCPVLTVRHDQCEPRNVIQNILVPIDFSERSEQALWFAADLARSYRAELALLHVVEEVALPGVYGLDPVPVHTPDVIERAQSSLDALIQQLPEAVPATANVLPGHAARDILDYAGRKDVDLIVIATHGRTGIEHLLLGSVAEKVVRLAPCPVCTMRSTMPPLRVEEAEPLKARTIKKELVT
jgi:nucleotide-binding universal stress UspA family protein